MRRGNGAVRSKAEGNCGRGRAGNFTRTIDVVKKKRAREGRGEGVDKRPCETVPREKGHGARWKVRWLRSGMVVAISSGISVTQQE